MELDGIVHDHDIKRLKIERRNSIIIIYYYRNDKPLTRLKCQKKERKIHPH